MEKVRVLFVFQEITPYLPESPMSLIGRNLPQGIQEKGKEIRIFMPKYGCINERRNQLHEVIRLSGMNLIINNNDHPLIIKVASIQSARMQIYFIDNEDFFSRKHTLKDDNNNEFPDNDERLIFFNRGVIETINKLNWTPDIIHCHGWFTSLLPLYVKKSYHDNPLFANTKIVYSIYNDAFKKQLNTNFKNKVLFDGVTKKDVEILTPPSYINLIKLAVKHSDAIILGSKDLHKDIPETLKGIKKPVLPCLEEAMITVYSDFYDKIVAEK